MTKNMPEDLKAWEIIIIIEDRLLTLFILIRNTIVNAMWDTDENAITFFKSTVNKQVAPTNISLNKESIINMLSIVCEDMVALSRKTPKPPSFSKIPARTIDPYTGASTWAKGSQR